jgi:FtsZ-binding cell division protein ZapB
MDIEKLIVSLRSPSWQDLEDPDAPLLEDAATALSMLQDENERLREMYQKEKAVCHATQAELDQMKRENETLKHALQNWHEEV